MPVWVALGAAFYFSLRFEPSPVFIAVAGILALAGAAVWPLLRRTAPLPAPSWPEWLLEAGENGRQAVSLGLAGFALAGWASWRQPPFPALPSTAIVVTGRIAALAPCPYAARRGCYRLRLAGAAGGEENILGPLEMNGRILRLTGSGGMPEGLEAGRKIRLRVLLRDAPSSYFPGAFDPRRSAWFNGTGAFGRILGRPEVLESPNRGLWGFDPETWWNGLRARTGKWIFQQSGRTQEGAVLAVLLSGAEGYLSQETRDLFAVAGLSHLLAVAGLHLGIVTGLFFCLFRAGFSLSQTLLLRFNCQKLALWGALLCGTAYILFTGSHLPGIRALLMGLMAALAVSLNRKALSLRSLSIVALVVELFSPFSVMGMGFQMSFCAVMALIAGGDFFRFGKSASVTARNAPEKLRFLLFRLGHHGAELFGVSLLAGCAVLPVAMFFFSAIQPWFILANLFAVPLTGLWVMPWGFAALFLHPLGLEGFPLFLAGRGIAGVFWLTEQTARLPWAHVSIPHMPGAGLLTGILGMCVLCLWTSRWRYLGTVLILGGLASPWVIRQPDVFMDSRGDYAGIHAKTGELRIFSASPRTRPPAAIPPALAAWGKAVDAKIYFETSGCRQCVVSAPEGSVLALRRDRQRKNGKNEADPADGEQPDCEKIRLVLALENRTEVCPETPELSSRQAREQGAWAGWLRSGRPPVLVSSREYYGRRIWNSADSRLPTRTLPYAKSE